MNKRSIIYASLVLLLLSCSDKTKDEVLNLVGEIRGKVYFIDEFGVVLGQDFESAKVTLEGAETFTTTTDFGDFVFKGIPTGIYNLTFEKPGFSSHRIEDYRVLGGEEPLYVVVTLDEHSKTRVSNLSLYYNYSTDAASWITVEGMFTHNAPFFRHYVNVVAFLSDSPDVSPEDYLQSSPTVLILMDGENFSTSISVSSAYFPSGSTVYAVMCGYARETFYDPEKGRFEYSGVGTPSNVASIQIP